MARGYFQEHLASSATPPALEADPELHAVADRVRSIERAHARAAEALRDTIDQLLDGQRTGRYDWKTLRKTEKTHMGTLVEINLHREFDFADGVRMDYSVGGTDVDCKFSQTLNGWEFPPEALGHLCLLVWADDNKSRFKLGLVRVDDGYLRLKRDGTKGGNRDGKRKLTPAGFERILWLFEGNLPENVLLHMNEDDRAAVFSARTVRGRKTGQARINMLFEKARGRLVRRNVVLTVAQQADSPKRVRDARLPGQADSERLIVLGHLRRDTAVASAFGLPVPTSGSWVSARVAEVSADFAGPVAVIDGRRWRLVA